jgi:hypothetical protein
VIGVWVDLNSRRDGLVPAFQDQDDGVLEVGVAVYAWDENEPGLRVPAVVVAFDEVSREALLEVDWDRVEDSDDTASNFGTLGSMTWDRKFAAPMQQPRLKKSQDPHRELV